MPNFNLIIECASKYGDIGVDSITNRLTILKKSLKKCKDANRKKIKRRAMVKGVSVDEHDVTEDDNSENSSLTSVLREVHSSEENLNEKTNE